MADDHIAVDVNPQGELLARDIMRSGLPTLSPDDSVPFLARQLAESGLPGLPVLENGALIGLVTEVDLIAREAEVEMPVVTPFLDAILRADVGRQFGDEVRKALAITARQLMSAPVLSVLEDATVTEVATLMVERHLNPIPVLDRNHRLIGLITRTDVVRLIAMLEYDGATV